MKTKSDLTKSTGEIIISGSALENKFLAEQMIRFTSPDHQEMVPRRSDKMEFEIFSKKDASYASPYQTFLSYIGNPSLPAIEFLSEDELDTKLEELQQLMLSKDLIVVSFTGIENRKMYRFLTEEFLNIEMTGSLYMHPTRYIYEEFHPNEEYNLKCWASDFLRAFFGPCLFDNEYKSWKRILSNYADLKNFRSHFYSFDEVAVIFESLHKTEEKATLIFNLKYIGVLGDQVMVKRFDETGTCEFVLKDKFWTFDKVVFQSLQLYASNKILN